jgi:hypothetical protein
VCERQKKKEWLLTPSWFKPPFLSFEKSHFYNIIIVLSKSQVSIDLHKIDCAMENSCLAAILILSTIFFNEFNHQSISLDQP